jgi:hypothetical protein
MASRQSGAQDAVAAPPGPSYPVVRHPAAPAEGYAIMTVPAPPAQALPLDPVAARPASRPEAAAVQQVKAEEAGPAIPPPAEAPARPSLATLAAQATSSHAPDYSWVCGEVEYSRLDNACRLRYGPPGEADPFGGSIILTNDAIVRGLQDGQIVRVYGRLVRQGEARTAAPYWVESVELVARPD